MRNKLLLIFPVVLIGCASYAYKFYGIEFPKSGLVDDVKLFVPKGSEAPKDIMLTTCKPDDQISGKCVVSLTSDYFNLIRDNETCHTRLAELQRTCGSR